MCFDDSIKMTVTEGPEYHEPFKMTKLNPFLSSDYSKHLNQIAVNNYVHTQAWDMTLGVHNLAETIAMMKKALDKKNGIKVIESKDMYHNQLDF